MIQKILHPFRVLHFPDFKLLSIGVFISFIGSQMQVVGIAWHIYSLTHSAYSLGFIGLAGFLPMVVLSPFSGVIIDAFDRKKILLVNQAILVIVNTVFAYLAITAQTTPLIIYTVVVINAIVNLVDVPTRQAIIPSLVPKIHLMEAFNINTISRQTANIIGPAIAGFIIAFYNIGIIYLVNAISFAIFFFLTLNLVESYKEERKKVIVSLSSVWEGIVYIKSSPILYSTMLLDFFANFFAASTVIFPIFAVEVLHIPTSQIGLLYAAPAVGAVLTGLCIGLFSHIKQQGKLLLWMVVIYGVGTIGFGLSGSFAFSLVCLFIVGSADMISMVVRRTLTQLITPDHIRGRMNSINMLFFAGGPFLGEAEAGFAAGLIGAPMAVVVGGLGAIFSAIGIAYFVPSLVTYVVNLEEHQK